MFFKQRFLKTSQNSTVFNRETEPNGNLSPYAYMMVYLGDIYSLFLSEEVKTCLS